MMTAVEKAIPKIDIELPPGLRLGVEGKAGPLAPFEGQLTPEQLANGDRELASAFVLMFEGLKNGRALCVAFSTEKLAAAAKRVWRDWGNARIIALSNPGRAAFGAGNSILQTVRRPFLVAVSPSTEQLKALSDLEDAKGAKLCLILLNARIRGLSQPDEVRDRLALAYNPAFHARFVGPNNQGMVFHTLSTPWILARRKSFMDDMEEVWRGDSEPTAEAIHVALSR